MRPRPVLLPSNQFDHFYLGGDRIAALRGGSGGPRRPEEWIASTTTRFGQERAGLSRLPDGSLLRERVLADPVAWLGPAHVARYGGYDVELLVKLLDAGQRLPVHAHPDRAFARRHLGLAHGKTEAWYVLDADPGAVVGLGFREAMSAADVAGMVGARKSAELVAAVHEVPVGPGDAVLVPAGAVHYIGRGILVLELQEPTDLSILLEWEGLAVDGARDGHLGLGFDVALQAVDLSGWGPGDVERCVRRAAAEPEPGLTSVLPGGAEGYFRADRVAPSPGAVTVPAGFSVLVVVSGAGTIETADAGGQVVRRGDVALLPWAAGDWTVDGELVALLARPPAPDAPQGR